MENQSIRKFVLTLPKDKYLKDFDVLYQKFWEGEYEVVSSNAKYSDMLIKYFSEIPDDYIMLMNENYYLKQKVDNDRYKILAGWAMTKRVDRFGLQSIQGYERAVTLATTIRKVGGEPLKIYQINKDYSSVISFEASIWRREFLLKYLKEGEDLSQAGVNASVRAEDKHHKVYTTEDPTLIYKTI